MQRAAADMQCECPRPEPGDEQRTEQQDADYVLDPSGYVYEAVPSNRLEGVTATLYYQDTDQSTGQVIWDASEYSQQNPVKSDANGQYAWFVPEGNWKVIFTKDGYEPADSSNVPASVDGWLPVPPPQFNVDVGMVSTAAPTVERVIAYNDRIEVAFSQYMDIESVQDAISLNRDGQPIRITVEPLDAEYNLEETVQYATRFAVIPADGDCTGTITVSTGAKNYAATSLAESHTAELTALIQRPTDIAVSGQLGVVYNDATTVTLTLQPGIAGKTLEVQSLTPSLLSATETVTTSADGTATVTLTGLLPGKGLIRVTEPESGLSESISVPIAMSADELTDADKPAPVTATLSDDTLVTSGMTVESGAQITLSTSTEDAVVRYTLDDTSPCKETALTYEGPITIIKDTVLRAAALLNGVYSDTIRLELTVANGTEDPDVPGGSGGLSSGGGGGGSMSSGRPVVEVAGEGGTATAGNDGTVTITPDEGYKIGKITVNGEEVAIPADGKLSGLDKNVKVVVTFEKIEEVPAIIGSFKDVLADAWYAEAVQYALDNGIMNGTGATTFAPNESTTRAMIVTMLYRLEGEPDIDGESLGYPFADVDANAYYGDPVYWARLHGIVNGVSGTSYAPDDAITREQLAAILYRYAQYKGYDTSVGDMSLAGYTDADQISAYAAAAMQWANGNGLITGRTDTTLVPQGTATRAEVATILMRFCTDVAQ